MAEASKSRQRHQIVVAGDVAIDWLQWSVAGQEKAGDNITYNWVRYPGTRMKAEAGGALLLAKMIKAATKTDVITHELSNIENIPSEKVIHSITILDKFPSSIKDKDKNTYRVRQFGGFSGPATEKLEPLPIVNDDPHARLVVLDDGGNGFRDDLASWPKAITEGGKDTIVILKMSRPLGFGTLWDHLQKNHSRNLVTVISVDALREFGINISRCVSWEQTAEDFRWQIANNPAIRSLAGCHHLLVRFGLEGAIYYRRDGKNDSARLYYDPAFMEDCYKGQYKGEMQGVGVAFIAALTAEIAANGLEGITKGIYAGLQKSRQLFIAGFGRSDETPGYPVAKVFSMPEGEKMPFSEAIIPPITEKAYGKNQHWTILEDYTKGNLENIACNIVLKNEEASLRNVPSARYGNLFTMDRYEIENLQSIKNLMNEYIGKKDANLPLSIAVFGPPGSGKSFGVTQLATSIDERVVRREFNVAQFTSTNDLIDAFHKVRDLVLEGKIPLVFFDEFDASYNGDPLGWLKYFLAPMQDGVFKEGETMHPIGKAILVFAGGTSYNFQQFSREHINESLIAEKREQILAEFREAKGTDFVSRLRGYINVLGPNRAGADDAFFMVRRALLLRSLLKKKAPQILDEHGNLRIDSGLLRAFIKVPAYKHGARSMEAIIDMSTQAGANSYEQSSLPSAKQLELHVDSDIFSKLMLRDVLFNDAMERLAMTAHAYSVKDQKGKKDKNDPAMQPWNKLRADFKESGRNRARQIPEKLHRLGLDFMPYVEKPKLHFKFSDDQVETLAEIEHDRWMAERLAEGWVLGKNRDPYKKISPYLVPWSELPENIKYRDRDPVRRIPELLEKAGFEIYPLQ